MMKKIFLYLQPVVEIYATKAVIYYLPRYNSYAVHNCYYYYYNPVRGYTLSYHLRAFIAVLLKREWRTVYIK